MLLRRLQKSINIGEVENALFGFHSTPGGFGYPDSIHPGGLHHSEICIYPVFLQVFGIVGNSEEQYFQHSVTP